MWEGDGGGGVKYAGGKTNLRRSSRAGAFAVVRVRMRKAAESFV